MPSRSIYTVSCLLITLCSRAMALLASPPTPVLNCASAAANAHQLRPSHGHARRSPAAVRRNRTAMLAKGFGADKNKPTTATKKDKGRNAAENIIKAIKSNKTPAASAPCPCFSGSPYGECCKPFHDGEKIPQPVQVMRARYSAYACNMPQFIMKSTHPEHEDFGKPGWRDDILLFCNNYKFTGLEVGEPEVDQDTPGKVFVYFTAMMAGAKGDGAVSFDERSVFLLTDEGEWLYRAPDSNYKESVNVISKRKYNATAKTDKPSGFSPR